MLKKQLLQLFRFTRKLKSIWFAYQII